MSADATTLMASQVKTVDELRVTGELSADAVIQYSAGAITNAFLFLEITPNEGMPYFVVQNLGSDPKDHYAAQAKAQVMKRGCRVQVYAQGVRVRADHGRAGLKLMGVSNVFLIHKAGETASTQEA